MKKGEEIKLFLIPFPNSPYSFLPLYTYLTNAPSLFPQPPCLSPVPPASLFHPSCLQSFVLKPSCTFPFRSFASFFLNVPYLPSSTLPVLLPVSYPFWLPFLITYAPHLLPYASHPLCFILSPPFRSIAQSVSRSQELREKEEKWR